MAFQAGLQGLTLFPLVDLFGTFSHCEFLTQICPTEFVLAEKEQLHQESSSHCDGRIANPTLKCVSRFNCITSTKIPEEKTSHVAELNSISQRTGLPPTKVGERVAILNHNLPQSTLEKIFWLLRHENSNSLMLL